MNLYALMKPLGKLGNLIERNNSDDAIRDACEELLRLLNPTGQATVELNSEVAAASELLPEGKPPLLLRLWRETMGLVNVDALTAKQREEFALLTLEVQMAIAWHKAPQTAQEFAQWCRDCAEVLYPIVVLDAEKAYRRAGYFANESVRKARTFANLLGLAEAAEACGERRDGPVDDAFHRLCSAARKADAMPLPRIDERVPPRSLYDSAQVDLKGERFRRLHHRFLNWAERFPLLHYIAATGHNTCPKWPLVPYRTLEADTIGLTKSHWLSVTSKPPGTLFVPMSDQWLRIEGQLWNGAFYFDGRIADPTDEDPESLRRQHAEIREAIDQFELLAHEAAGFLGDQPSVHPGVHFPRKPELWHRWLEAVCASVQVEPAGYHSFDVRRVPGNIFQASAIHLERLQRAAGITTSATRPHAPLKLNECDLRPVLAAAEAFLTERHKADKRSAFDDAGAIHILGVGRRRLGEALKPYQHPDGIFGDDPAVAAVKTLGEIATDPRADSSVNCLNAIIEVLWAVIGQPEDEKDQDELLPAVDTGEVAKTPSRGLSPGQQNIVDVIREAGHRLSQDEVLAALHATHGAASIGTTKNYLAALVRFGVLTNRRDVEPPGYGLAEWR